MNTEAVNNTPDRVTTPDQTQSPEKAASSEKIRTMAMIAVMTAVVCILGPMSVPIGPVPISLTPLAVFLCVYALGMKKGTLAICLYLLIGLVGLPVFSGYTGGPMKLFGPTGGYLIGFVPMALIAGWFIDRFAAKWYLHFAGMFTGLWVLYGIGTLWLSRQAGMTLAAAFGAGVAPFILLDTLKIVVGILVGRALRKSLAAAGLVNYRD